MTDRELLELAAKAAGIEYNFICPDGAHCGDMNTMQDRFWNPLEDDGDAFRLAVTLEIDFVHCFGNHTAVAENTSGYAAEGPDPYSAARRAIVSVAAEIGTEMK
jgi:hypothetical protein